MTVWQCLRKIGFLIAYGSTVVYTWKRMYNGKEVLLYEKNAGGGKSPV